MFDLQPSLSGEMTQLFPMRDSDWHELYRVASDPEIWELHPARNRYEEKEFREYFDTGLSSGGALTIRATQSGTVIGASRYYGYYAASREVEIGWTFLAKAYWGGAYNREIKRLMLSHAFQFVDIVVFWVGLQNWRSQRAMEKIGGIRRKEMIDRSYNGQTAPHIIYEIANRPGWEILLS
jgi:N-acetyltransferase